MSSELLNTLPHHLRILFFTFIFLTDHITRWCQVILVSSKTITSFLTNIISIEFILSVKVSTQYLIVVVKCILHRNLRVDCATEMRIVSISYFPGVEHLLLKFDQAWMAGWLSFFINYDNFFTTMTGWVVTIRRRLRRIFHNLLWNSLTPFNLLAFSDFLQNLILPIALIHSYNTLIKLLILLLFRIKS